MKDMLIKFVVERRATLIGVTLALTTAILFLTIGFWRTALIIGLILIGLKCGSIIDSGDSVLDRFISFCMKIADIFKKRT